MHNFRELKVWQKGLNFAVSIYKTTSTFPKEEEIGLTSQLNRAATSIPSIIAEGAGRNADKDFNNFLGMALGSTFEVETQLIIAQRLCFIDKDTSINLIGECTELQKMVVNLQKALINKINAKV
ncbi:MAG: four helix bundle protein [Cytophagaceae bacterium]|nr:four helix bundle protein [Cytophagaceae bacterium]